jgi:hypothetical protein
LFFHFSITFLNKKTKKIFKNIKNKNKGKKYKFSSLIIYLKFLAPGISTYILLQSESKKRKEN